MMKTLVVLIVALTLTACGGGGGGGGRGGDGGAGPAPVKVWGTAQLIETENAGDALSPQIAFDPAGNALAVWYQHDGTRYNIWSNRYTAGGGWGTAQLIEIDNTGNALSPQIAIDPSGNALAVWSQESGTVYNLWANATPPAAGGRRRS